MSDDTQARIAAAVRAGIREYADAAGLGDGDLAQVRALGREPRAGRRPYRFAPLGPLVVAAAVVAIAVVAVSLIGQVPPERRPAPDRTASGVVDATGPATAGRLSWLPPVVAPPTKATPTLPTNRAVGPGALLYAPCKNCDAHLVTESGATYRLPGQPGGVTLSPDGRWLGERRDGRFVLRDLTGTAERAVVESDVAPLAWSPEGRWLLLFEPKPVRARLFDSATGRLSRFAVSGSLYAVLPSGRVVMSGDGPTLGGEQRTELSLDALDVASGKRERLVDIDAAPVLTEPDPKVTGQPGLSLTAVMGTLPLDPAGTRLAVPVRRYFALGEGGGADLYDDVLVVDLGSRSVRRYDLPTPRTPTTRYDPASDAQVLDAERRTVLAFRAEGILLSRADRGRVEAELLDPDTGHRSVICRLPDGTNRFVVRGGAM